MKNFRPKQKNLDGCRPPQSTRQQDDDNDDGGNSGTGLGTGSCSFQQPQQSSQSQTVGIQSTQQVFGTK